MMAVEIRTQPAFEAGTPKVLFNASVPILVASGGYDVMQNGRRFLVCTFQAETNALPLTIVLNWTAALEGSRP